MPPKKRLTFLGAYHSCEVQIDGSLLRGWGWRTIAEAWLPQRRTAIGTEARSIGNDGVTDGAIEVMSLIEIEKRFFREYCSAFPAVTFGGISRRTTYAADLTFFHGFRPKAEALHGIGTCLAKITHRSNLLHSGVRYRNVDRYCLPQRACVRIVHSSWVRFPTAHTRHTLRRRR